MCSVGFLNKIPPPKIPMRQMHDVRISQARGPGGGDAAARSAEAPAANDHGPVLIRPDEFFQAGAFFV